MSALSASKRPDSSQALCVALERFLEKPSARNYRELRQQILAPADFRPDFLAIAELEQLFQEGRFSDVLDRVQQLMPQWSLCPRVHFHAARAAQQLGDLEELELNRFLLSTCLEGILATGDGSLRRPYLVTYSSDPVDVLKALRLTAQSQTVIQRGAKLLDELHCEDGRARYFDVTQLLSRGLNLSDLPLVCRS